MGINYRLFYRLLGGKLALSRLPEHVAIIMDGNGRWAQQRGLSREDGHKAGINSVKASVQSCIKHQISILSLFAFSSENWFRPAKEVDALMTLFFQSLTNELDELIENKVQLKFTGNRDRFLPELRDLMNIAEEKTTCNSALILNVCINYGGQWDILQAVQAIAEKVEKGYLSSKKICFETINEHMATYPLPPPDFFIRTSGERRISNFFLWQAAYTELYFTDILWPDFNEAAFENALHSFNNRHRRFGLVD